MTSISAGAAATATIVSWDDFKLKTALLQEQARADHTSVLFRGHASSQWDLETTLERSAHSHFVTDYYGIALRIKSEIEAFTGLRWAEDADVDYPKIQSMCSRYENFSACFSRQAPPHYAYLSYLRHHGFPSPLLDWSTSRFVAAFFAFRVRPIAENVAIFAYRERDSSGMKVGGNDVPAIRVCGPYVSGPKRHFAQRSQYTTCTMWDDNGPYFLSHNDVCKPFDPKKDFQQDIIFKFELPSSEREKVMIELEDYGLNAFGLFGSEEGLMESLSLREEFSVT